MSRLTKSIGLILSGLFLLIMLALMLFSLVDAYLPASFHFLRGFIGFDGFYRSFLATMLFWVAAVLAVLLVLVMLVLAFYPKTKKDYRLLKKDGHLSLCDTAVEGLVRSVLTSQGYMNNPKVHAKLYPKKMEIAVKGEFQDPRAIFERTEFVKAEIAQVLKDFVGVEKPMRFAITVDHIEANKQFGIKKKTARVE